MPAITTIIDQTTIIELEPGNALAIKTYKPLTEDALHAFKRAAGPLYDLAKEGEVVLIQIGRMSQLKL